MKDKRQLEELPEDEAEKLEKELRAEENRHGQALMNAIAEGDLPKLQCLLWSLGVDVNVQDQYGTRAFSKAVAYENIEIVKEMIKHVALDINSRENNSTALDVACQLGNIGIIELLFSDPRLDVNSSGYLGRTALHNMAKQGITKSVAALLKHPRIDIEKKDEEKKTALELAKRGKFNDIVTLIEEKSIQ